MFGWQTLSSFQHSTYFKLTEIASPEKVSSKNGQPFYLHIFHARAVWPYQMGCRLVIQACCRDGTAATGVSSVALISIHGTKRAVCLLFESPIDARRLAPVLKMVCLAI